MALVKFASKKQIVIISKNDLLMEAIVGLKGTSIRRHSEGTSSKRCGLSPKVDYHLLFSSLPKIDLLIVDSVDALFPHHKIKTIINIGGENRLSKDEIKFSKPLKLNNLLQIIRKTINCQDIFCAINNALIYNEVSRTLSSPEKVIKFTAKEDEIFKFILLNSDFNISKELLMRNIWQYHEDTESLTLDTHLYKLKTKLPKGLLEVKNNICRLNIMSII